MAICLPYAPSLLAQSLAAEHLQYPDVFLMLLFRRGRAGGEDGGGGGQRVRGRRGGFQSDRLTEKSDNERSGLSGVQTASRAR